MILDVLMSGSGVAGQRFEDATSLLPCQVTGTSRSPSTTSKPSTRGGSFQELTDSNFNYLLEKNSQEPLDNPRLTELGYPVQPVKELKNGETPVGKFFFLQDPDGYKIEVLQKAGHFQ